jgi:hypothetical protein
MWTLRRRGLGENCFSGTVPTTISALTTLSFLYASPRAAGLRPIRSMLCCGSAKTARSVRPYASLCAVRDLSTNGFTGPILASITALTKLVWLCAPPPPV